MAEYDENAELDTSQVEDRRGGGGGGGMFGGAGGAGGGGGGRLPIPGGGVTIGGGIVGLLVAVVLGALGVSGNLDLGGGGSGDNRALAEKCSTANPSRFDEVDCRNVLYINSIQDYWQRALPERFGKPYQQARTVFFNAQVSTGCGAANSGVGPFYCPADNKVYIDLSFWDQLARRFGAPGQFAQAYVLAHEYGHHVQTLLGTEAEVRRLQQRDPRNANQYSVMLELQADCYAGVWAKQATTTRDEGGNPLLRNVSQREIDEALQAAAAVGDDAIQGQAGGGVNPDSWTHGSSAQRQRWFSQGYSTGDPRTCNTFSGV